MKRLAGALMSICPDSTGDFQAMMDGYDEADQESCLQLGSEKKRRLSADQVKALEKNFEVENKLEPERKARLAQELGLQPRQVAVWFQNRRARWKTKQLERDYGALKADYDRLRLDFEKLHRDNEALIEEIRELKSKAGEGGDRPKDEECKEEEAPAIKNPSSSDSCDSSAVLNEDVNRGGGGVNAGGGGFQYQDSKVGYQQHHHQQQLVKIEEHNFFGEESCSTLFSEYQAPSLHWDEWS